MSGTARKKRTQRGRPHQGEQLEQERVDRLRLHAQPLSKYMAQDKGLREAREAFEKDLMQRAFAKNWGNMSRTAADLGGESPNAARPGGQICRRALERGFRSGEGRPPLSSSAQSRLWRPGMLSVACGPAAGQSPTLSAPEPRYRLRSGFLAAVCGRQVPYRCTHCGSWRLLLHAGAAAHEANDTGRVLAWVAPYRCQSLCCVVNRAL
jgi:hypothetical protein